jgi:Spy/CpxP family protein refolding chaperone
MVAPLAVGGLAAAEPAVEGAEFAGRFIHTPLGKLISGRLGRAMVLRSELDLTAKQRKEVRTILMSHRKEIATALRPVSENRRALRAAVLADQPDEQQIRAASDKLGKSIGDAAVQLSKVAGEVKQVMTSEQLSKIDTFRDDNAAALDRFFDRATGK